MAAVLDSTIPPVTQCSVGRFPLNTRDTQPPARTPEGLGNLIAYIPPVCTGIWQGEDVAWELSGAGCGVLSHVLGRVTISRTNILPGLYLEKAPSGTS